MSKLIKKIKIWINYMKNYILEFFDLEIINSIYVLMVQAISFK